MRSLGGGIGVFVALAAALLATGHAPTTLHSPLRPEGVWATLWTSGLILAFVCYVIGLLTASRAPPAGVIAVAAAIQLLPLAAPVLLSTDVYSYWQYGRIAAVHHANPYAARPTRFPTDPAFRRAGADWRERRTVYGPVFTLASEGPARLAGESHRVAALLFRLLAALSVIATAAFAAVVTPRKAFAAAFVGWNPLFALHFGGGGHNDALMAALLMGGFAAASVGRFQLEGAAWALSSAVKIVPVVFLPLSMLARGGRFGWRGLLAASAAIAAAASTAYGVRWTTIFTSSATRLHETSSLGLPYWGAKLGVPDRIGRDFLLYSFAVGYAWLIWQAWLGRARLALAACLLLLTTSWLQPWYAIWAVPLAAVEEDTLARVLAVGLSAYFLRDALPI